MVNLVRRAFANSLGVAVYVIFVVLLISSLENIFSAEPDSLIFLMAMLLLFICSAAITGFLVFGKPLMLYLDGKKKEAVSLLAYTITFLFLIIIVTFVLLIVYYNFFL